MVPKPLRFRSVALILVASLAPLSAGDAWAVAPTDATVGAGDRAQLVADAVLSQQTLPQLQARAAAASARSEALERYLSGQAQLEAAAPELAGAPLNAAAFLDARLASLDLAASKRAGERVVPVPLGLSPREIRRWQSALDDVLDLEDRSDTLARRVLLGLRLSLERAPALAQGRLEAECLAELRRTAQRSPAADADPQIAAAVLAEADAAGGALSAMNALLRAAWRASTVPGDNDLRAWVDPQLAAPPRWALDGAQHLRAWAWRDRLQRAGPLLGEQQSARVTLALDTLERDRLSVELPALIARRDQLRAPQDRPVTLADAVAVADLQAELDRARAALAVFPEQAEAGAKDSAAEDSAAEGSVEVGSSSVEELPALRTQEASLRRELAQLQVDRAAARLSAAQQRVSTQAQSSTDRMQAQAVRRKADEAVARAQASASEQEAAVRGELATLQVDLADRLDGEERRHYQTMVSLSDLEQRWRASRSAARLALALPPLAVGRDQTIDDAYRELRAVVARCRQAVAARRDHVAEVRGERRRRSAIMPDLTALSPDLRTALAQDVAAMELDLQALSIQRRQDASVELSGALKLLSLAKQDRRKLRTEATPGARDDVLRGFMSEARQEALEAPAVVSAQLRDTVAAARALPQQVTDLTVVLRFLRHSFELVFLAIAWFALRRGSERWAARLLDALARWREQVAEDRKEERRSKDLSIWFVDGDLRALAQPLAPVLFAAVDIAVAAVLFGLARGSLAPLALVLLIWLARGIYRGLPLILALVWATPEEVRPALAVVAPGTLARARQSLRMALLAVLSVTVLRFVALDLFEADRFADLVGAGRTLAYGAVSLWLLWIWADALREAVATTGDQSSLGQWLSATDDVWLLRIPRSAGGLLYVVWRGGAELLVRVAEGQPGLGWLASALARARLRQSNGVGVDLAPLDAQALAELDATVVAVPRPDQLQQLDEALCTWGADHGRGMVAIIGDRGSGKSQMLDVVVGRLAQLLPELPMRRIALAQHLSRPGPALAWLAQVTGAQSDEVWDCEEDVEPLVAALMLLPATAFLIDDLHRLVLRAVGGFGGARAVLRVMLATSQQHLWICTVHRPTWNYLIGLRSSINLEALRIRIELGALPAPDLGAWVTQRVETAGYSVGFDDLIGGNPVGMNAHRAHKRAEQAYWRILADASMGLPDVAWLYFRSALCAGRGLRVLSTQMFQAPSTKDLESLPDLDLFCLTAVVIHDRLSSAGVGEVLNAPLTQVQEACRHLAGRGVLEGERSGSGWGVAPVWRPAVQRVLRQRHFLYQR